MSTMETQELIDHVKKLITTCNKDEYHKIHKHIVALQELSRLQSLEKKENGKGTPPNNPDKTEPMADDVIIGRFKALHNAITVRTIALAFFIFSVLFFYNLAEKQTARPAITCKECVMMQAKVNNNQKQIVPTNCEKESNATLSITVYLLGYSVLSLCFLFIYKHEYNAWMKDKELCNDLKKTYYQWHINKMMKQ